MVSDKGSADVFFEGGGKARLWNLGSLWGDTLAPFGRKGDGGIDAAIDADGITKQ